MLSLAAGCWHKAQAKPKPDQPTNLTALPRKRARGTLQDTNESRQQASPLPTTFPPEGEIFVFNINVNLFSFPWRCCFLGAARKNFTPRPRPNRALQLALLRSRYTAKCNQRARKCTVLLWGSPGRLAA